MNFKRKGDKAKYSFLDARCIGRTCWAPGMYQHRSMMAGGGSRNTGSPDTPCCMNRAYRGCPAGPEGEHEDACDYCGVDGKLEDGKTCPFCVGTKKIKIRGVPVYDPAKAKERAAEGWRKA